MTLSDLLVRFTDKKSFPRGIHPPERKDGSEHQPIEVLPTPATVLLPLHQHTGAPAESVLKPRAELALGDLVGEAKGFISARVHAPVAGASAVITAATLPNGRRSLVVPITSKPDGMPQGRALFEEMYGGDWSLAAGAQAAPEEIVQAIRDAGIVGQGGAAFPTHVKVTRNPQKPVSLLLLNGCECEPYLTSDYRLMVEAPTPIVAGLALAMRAAGAAEGIVAIEDNKPDAIAAMRGAAQNVPGVRVVVCATKYPQGGERQLIQAVCGKEVPTGGLPLDVGVVVMNVGTAAAVARAVLRGGPMTHRIVSISGRGIRQPKNLLVPVGVRIQELLDACGGLTDDARRLVAGGPMMGFTLADASVPVTKGTSGITVLVQEEIDRSDATTCVRCGRCLDVCPLNLMPTRIAMASRAGDLELAQKWDLMACCECGCCAFACPARVPLAQHIRAGKLAVLRQGRK